MHAIALNARKSFLVGLTLDMTVLTFVLTSFSINFSCQANVKSLVAIALLFSNLTLV